MMIIKTDKFIQLTNSLGKFIKIDRSDPNYKIISNMVKKQVVDEQQYNRFFGLDMKIFNTLFNIRNGMVYYQNEMLPLFMSSKLLEFHQAGIDIQNLENFWVRLQKNKITRNVNFLYEFLYRKGHPITQDGCFLAYKTVKSDYMDKYTGCIANIPNTWVYMTESQVDPDPMVGCSTGLHVGNWAYVNEYISESTDRIMLIRVAPEDIVSVPLDCSCQKMRCSKYFVLKEYTKQEPMDIQYVKISKKQMNTIQKTSPVRDVQGRFVKQK